MVKRPSRERAATAALRRFQTLPPSPRNGEGSTRKDLLLMLACVALAIAVKLNVEATSAA
jgi:hypothetical protein